MIALERSNERPPETHGGHGHDRNCAAYQNSFIRDYGPENSEIVNPPDKRVSRLVFEIASRGLALGAAEDAGNSG
jgi:hypothetical protein